MTQVSGYRLPIAITLHLLTKRISPTQVSAKRLPPTSLGAFRLPESPKLKELISTISGSQHYYHCWLTTYLITWKIQQM
jgi:hypothetical protein